MRIKSTVWHWLAAGSLCAGLLCGMGLEGNAQVGAPITDGQFVTAMVLVLAAGLFGLCGPGAGGKGQTPGAPAAGEHRESRKAEGGVSKMRYRVHIEMSRDGYPLGLQTALLVGGSSQGVAKARALELAKEQHPECDDFRVYHMEELGKCKKTL
jgi:hypothetical protein